jgi:hypothetical protein
MEETHLKIVPPDKMKVEIIEGMDPIPDEIAEKIQALIEGMRAQGKSDHSIQKYFKHHYKVNLIYV